MKGGKSVKSDELDIIYKKYSKLLFLYAFSLTKNRADAEDLVADAFVKAVLSFEDGNIQAWLFTVVKNEFYNLCKKKYKLYDEIDFEKVPGNMDVIDEIIKEDQKAWLFKQIYRLSNREQEVMLLSLQDGLDDEVIAKLTKQSVENVRVIRYRTKKKLIELCKQEGML